MFLLAEHAKTGVDEVLHTSWHRPVFSFAYDQPTIGLTAYFSCLHQGAYCFDQQEGNPGAELIETVWQVPRPLDCQMRQHMANRLLVQRRQIQPGRPRDVADSRHQDIEMGHVEGRFGAVGANDQ